jgi:hypothetical protein
MDSGDSRDLSVELRDGTAKTAASGRDLSVGACRVASERQRPLGKVFGEQRLSR